jgi:hypothetical protein
VRDAVHAHCRYYGIRIKDLAIEKGSSWIAAAMKKGPMTVDTAKQLAELINSPQLDRVGTKRPRGATWEVLSEILKKSEGKINPKYRDDPGLQHQAFGLMMHLVLANYTMCIPGSNIFVMPGGAQSVADHVVSLADRLGLSKRKREHLQAQLYSFFVDSERPLDTELGKKLVPRLTVLGIVNFLKFTNEALKVLPMTDEENSEIGSTLRKSIRAEGRRERIVRKPKPNDGNDV